MSLGGSSIDELPPYAISAPLSPRFGPFRRESRGGVHHSAALDPAFLSGFSASPVSP